MESLKALTYPIFKIDEKHHYSEIIKGLETLKQMNYPVLVDYKHHFNEISERVKTIKDLVGPVYNVEHAMCL
jgi:hypothetical protein